MIKKLFKSLLSEQKKVSFALNQLDVRLEPYINFKNGFFIEVGANDGISQSNTLYFEKYKGWKGLLIEAIPALAEKCRQNRPGSIVENCALVGSGHPSKTITMRYCNLMSLVKGGMESNDAEDRHILAGMQYLEKNEVPYVIDVPAKTLSEILDIHRIAHVDLLSLDVEGYEAQALQGIEFGRHRIEYMLIEARYREEIEAIIGKFYKPIAMLNIGEFYADILYRRQ